MVITCQHFSVFVTCLNKGFYRHLFQTHFVRMFLVHQNSPVGEGRGDEEEGDEGKGGVGRM